MELTCGISIRVRILIESRTCRFSFAEVKPLEGPLKLNTRLDNAERLYEGKLLAPEHILERDGVLYAAVKNNQVVKIVDGQIKVVADFGRSCCKSLKFLNSFKYSLNY